MTKTKNILVLADGNAIHTIRWCKKLLEQDHSVTLFSLHPFKTEWYKELGIEVYSYYKSTKYKRFKKLLYLFSVFKLRKINRKNKINIINAHYASSYGLLAALSSPKKLFVTFWGTDVFVFPKKNFITKRILLFILKRSDIIFSSSHIMAKEITLYTQKDIVVVPFGIELKEYTPKEQKPSLPNPIKLGIVKTLEPIYRIDVAIKALDILNKKEGIHFQLTICGEGSLMDSLKEMSAPNVSFLGEIKQNEVAPFLYNTDIFLSPTDFESFGVSTIESMACGVPVIAFNAGGAAEIINHNTDGILYSPNSPEELAKNILALIENDELRHSIIKNGIEKVKNKYNIEENSTIFLRYFNQ